MSIKVFGFEYSLSFSLSPGMGVRALAGRLGARGKETGGWGEGGVRGRLSQTRNRELRWWWWLGRGMGWEVGADSNSY